jgi:uncharacterized repeat protein (TIGR03803 family)
LRDVFKVSAEGVETVLYSFLGTSDGAYPYSVLVRDEKGNLYGTTSVGGDLTCDCGTVFKIDSAGNETILHSFTGPGGDGRLPYAGLRRDKTGNLYGTTFFGGTGDDGTVFKIDSTGVETVLYSFGTTPGDGYAPASRLIGDGKGNLYGTTYEGGTYNSGVAFKLDATYTETVLHAFNYSIGDGANPYSGLILDAEGNLYGTTSNGGAYGGLRGTVFQLDPTGKETILHSFKRKTRWSTAGLPGLVRDKAGNLYGTTNIYGGLEGTVFKVSRTGKETILHSFDGGFDGAYPAAGLVEDGKGNLYGTASDYGGSNGTVFKLTP